MTIYSDGKHLMTDGDVEELHTFARHMGLVRKWFQDHPTHPHYDLTTERAANRARRKGAREVSSPFMVACVRLGKGRRG